MTITCTLNIYIYITQLEATMYLNVSLPCISMKSKCVITGNLTASICFNQITNYLLFLRNKNHGASFQGLSLSALGVPSNCLEVTSQLQKLYLKWPGVKPRMWNQRSNVHIQNRTSWTPKWMIIWGRWNIRPFRYREFSGEPCSFLGGVPKKWGDLQMFFVSYWDHLSDIFSRLKWLSWNFGPFVWWKNVERLGYSSTILGIRRMFFQERVCRYISTPHFNRKNT